MNRVLFYSIFLLIFAACTPKTPDASLNTGTIDYRIEYPQQLKDKTISNILPEEMTVFFTPEVLKFKIKGDLNIFLLEYLSMANGDSCFTLFKVVNRKLYYPLVGKEQWFLFEKNPPIEFEECKDSIKTIAGLKCHQVIITYTDHPETEVKAYFTQEINLNRKLFNSPFNKINGIPLSFEVKYNNHTYRFVATKVRNTINNEKMYVPNDYKITTRQEIHSLVNTILN